MRPVRPRGIPRQIELLERTTPCDRSSTLHVIALEIALEAHAPRTARLEALRLSAPTLIHPWIGGRSVYTPDPERSVVEFACYDSTAI